MSMSKRSVVVSFPDLTLPLLFFVWLSLAGHVQSLGQQVEASGYQRDLELSKCTLDHEVALQELNNSLVETLGEPNQDDLQRAGVPSLFGQVAKAVVYGGASFARLNNRLLCPLLTSSYLAGGSSPASETNPADSRPSLDNEEQPTLFVFNDHLNNARAFKIFADEEITREMLDEAAFKRQQMTYIFVHGWLGGIHSELWLTEAKNAVLRSSWRSAEFMANVIVVDWSEYASGSLYSATRNSFKVSRRLAKMLEQLVSVGGLKAELMHCLGHSIGTHICGQAARLAFPVQPRPTGTPVSLYLNQTRLGRITGLDPGGFCFELGVHNESTYEGLRPSDALLVDAYYTNRSPFGNRYQVAHYNVRINNGFFQAPCSVWYNPDTARQYFRAAIRFLTGNTGNNELLTCDHYFATKLTEQSLPSQAGQSESNRYTSCSFVAYACDSYKSFVRGRCGQCGLDNRSCYTMDFEYQRTSASAAHAIQHIRRHSALASDSSSSSQPLGGVAYADRRVFYMRVSSDTNMCTMTFRVRLALNSTIIRPDWIKLRFTDDLGQQVTFREVYSGKTSDLLTLFGPWPLQGRADTLDSDELTGLNNRTLTGLFELPEVPHSPIRGVQIDCEPELRKRMSIEGDSFVDFVSLDYLSSSEQRIREYYSHTFRQHEVTVYHKQT